MDNRVSGDVDWQKTGPAGATDRTYPLGYGPVLLDADGSKWIRPASGTMLFGIPNQPGNLRIELDEGGISTAAQATSVNQTFQLLASGKTIFAPITSGNPTAMSLSITTSTGLFAGSFKLTDPKPGGAGMATRSVKTSGIMVPHLRRGYGHFLLPELSTNPPVKSGSVVLREP